MYYLSSWSLRALSVSNACGHSPAGSQSRVSGSHPGPNVTGHPGSLTGRPQGHSSLTGNPQGHVQSLEHANIESQVVTVDIDVLGPQRHLQPPPPLGPHF